MTPWRINTEGLSDERIAEIEALLNKHATSFYRITRPEGVNT